MINSVSVVLKKIPVIIRAVILGWLIMNVGVFSFSLLVFLNVKTTLQFPIAAIMMLPVIWVYWQYLAGRWAPRSTQAERKKSLRANGLSKTGWIWAALASISGIVFTLNFGALFQRIVNVFPDGGKLIPEGIEIPWWTLFPTFIMLSVVAGIFEEVGIRGYLQGMIERRHGPIIAILVSSAAFTYAHFVHDWGMAMAVPFFVASLWYGALTYLTNSVLPMILVHTAIDLYLFGKLLFSGPGVNPPPIAESGVDSRFLITTGLTIVFGTILILSLRKLSRV